MFPVRSTALTLLLLASATIATAVPITYTISNTVSGTIGAKTFSNVLVTVTSTGNTNDVVTRTFDPGDGSTYTAYFDSNVITTVFIPGIGIATVTMPTGVMSFPTPIEIEDGSPVTAYVILARLDESFVGDITGIAAAGGNSLINYNLKSSIGPITGAGVGYPDGDPLSTNLGNLAFTSNILATTSGTFTATISTTPEPSSLLLLSSGLIVLIAQYRRAR